jgi:23S rRNA G2069 N7-methylase RlmK/C1962 C5-methylase RlmI
LEKRIALEPRFADAQQIGRIFAGSSDGLDGVLVDAFGPLVVLTIYNPTSSKDAVEMLDALEKALGDGRFVLGKVRRQEGGFDFLDPKKVLGSHWVAREDDCLFEVRADDKNDFGLFPDARAARRALRSVVTPESSVLNLFSYTCGFAVVAMKTGAKSAINVDANSEMLTWGKRNGALNGVDYAVIPELAQKYLQRLQKRVEEGRIVCPDVWVCDPPAFGVGRGPQRVLKHFWEDFWSAVDALRPRAVLVLRNDRTGHRQGDTLERELSARWAGTYRTQAISFAECPSLCYEEPDVFYKLNESLMLLRC